MAVYKATITNSQVLATEPELRFIDACRVDQALGILLYLRNMVDSEDWLITEDRKWGSVTSIYHWRLKFNQYCADWKSRSEHKRQIESVVSNNGTRLQTPTAEGWRYLRQEDSLDLWYDALIKEGELLYTGRFTQLPIEGGDWLVDFSVAVMEKFGVHPHLVNRISLAQLFDGNAESPYMIANDRGVLDVRILDNRYTTPNSEKYAAWWENLESGT